MLETQHILRDCLGYVIYMFNVIMGWSIEKTMDYISHLRKQMDDPNVHGYTMVRVVYGRKPEAE